MKLDGCDCPTYQDNGGVCATFEAGHNWRCAYCDHTRRCHETRVCQPIEPPHPDSPARKAAVRIKADRIANTTASDALRYYEQIITQEYAAQTAELENLRATLLRALSATEHSRNIILVGIGEKYQ